jgi:membrane dipeptidase
MSRLRVIIPIVALLSLVACGRPREADAPAATSSALPAFVASSSASPSALPSAAGPKQPEENAALTLHRAAIVIDTHDDVTQRLVLEGVDLSTRLPDGQTDLPRMREGGLDAEFLSVWVAPRLYPKNRAYAQALAEFDAIDHMIAANAGSALLARTSAEIRKAAAEGKTAFLIGVEGGHALGDAPDAELLRRVRQFYDRGARYLTLTWSNSNRLGGSSGDDGKSRGLSSFGKQVVETMNELGMIVDISHVSDPTFFDAIHSSKRPVLASHSSARALSNHRRNMTDDMLRAVRDNGGAVCVNFGPQFLDAAWNEQLDALEGAAAPKIKAMLGKAGADPKAAQAAVGKLFKELAATLPPVPATLVIDHIEHIARIAGVEHVCLGSDYDGIAVAPQGLDDVSKLPFITEELLRRGFREADVRKVLGENVLRVLAANEH